MPSQAKARPTAQLLARIAIALLAVALSLLFLEGVFRAAGIRATYYEPPVSEAIRDPDGPQMRALWGFVPYATLRTTYSSDPRGYFDPGNRIDHHFNSAGFRDAEHTLLKPPGSYRILGLGDSYLYGQGVRREDVCLTRLEVLLNETAEQNSVETINFGISARNTEHELAALETRGWAYDPDLVILFFVLNDVEEDYDEQPLQINFFRQFTDIYLVPDRLSQYSWLWSWARQRWLRNVRARNYLADCLANYQGNSQLWARCEAALDRMRASCAEHDVPLLIVVFPFFYELDGEYPFQPIHDQLAHYAQTRDQQLLDLRGAYRDYCGPELWVHPTDQHPNEIAHRIAAEVVAEYVREHAAELRFDVATQGSAKFDADEETRRQARARVVQLQGVFSDDGKFLSFEGQPLHDADLRLLEPYWSGLRELEGLSLKGTHVTGSMLPGLATLQRLKGLDISGTQVRGGELRILEQLEQLEQLGLADLDVRDADLPILTASSSLTTLNVAGTRITDDGIRHLTGLPNLQVLVLSGTGVGDKGLDAIANLEHLRAVDLTDTATTPAGRQRLRESRPELTVVE